ncbi:MAG: hypothetical protein ACP5Q5_04810 [Brevinematia bacterium]
MKLVFLFLFSSLAFFVFFKIMAFYNKIEYRKTRVSYFATDLLDYSTIRKIEEEGISFFHDVLISVWERREVVFEFKNDLSQEKIKDIGLFLGSNFPSYKWLEPVIRRQEYISRDYINLIGVLFSLMFGLGASFSYFISRKINE